MLRTYPSITASAAAAAATAPTEAACPLRVTAFMIWGSRFHDEGGRWSTVVWRVLDLCAAAEQGAAHVFCGSSVNASPSPPPPPAALTSISLNMTAPSKVRANMPILSPLAATFPTAVLRSLRVLRIVGNAYDESAALGAFAALVPELEELALSWGLTSVKGLEGNCDKLTKVSFYGCEQLTSLDGLQHHVLLEEVNAAFSTITSLDPLLQCPALTSLCLNGCTQITTEVVFPPSVRIYM